jgi:hypothetical protein
MSMSDRSIASVEAEYRCNVVAVVYNNEGEVWDYAFNWESAQNYALHNGYRVEAIKDDGSMTIAEQQALYDAERARFNDCFGINQEDA